MMAITTSSSIKVKARFRLTLNQTWLPWIRFKGVWRVRAVFGNRPRWRPQIFEIALARAPSLTIGLPESFPGAIGFGPGARLSRLLHWAAAALVLIDFRKACEIFR